MHDHEYYDDYRDLKPAYPPGAGMLLVASPSIPPSIFYRSVVLLCEHGDQGSFGLVINVPTHISVGSVDDSLRPFQMQLFQGGPVQVNSLHFIHGDVDTDLDSKEIFPGVFWGQNYERLVEYAATHDAKFENFRFLAGYAGWAAGQLEEEIDRQDWFLTPATPDGVFHHPYKTQWDYVLRSMGDQYGAIADMVNDDSEAQGEG